MEKAGFKTCTVCGKTFELTAEEHYVARDDTKTGLSVSFSGEEPKLFDVMDCPHCGSQMLLNRRLRETCPCNYGICDECEEPDDEEDTESTLSIKETWEFLRDYLDGMFCEEDD